MNRTQSADIRIGLLHFFRPVLFLLLLVLALLGPTVSAATYTWDSDNVTAGLQDGGGTWSLVSTNWYNIGGTDQAWVNGTDTAQFGVGSGSANAYNVMLGVPITAGGLIFQNQAYTISGSTITLSGAAPVITMNASAGTISSSLAGTAGLTVAGSGLLDVQGKLGYTGTTNVNGGTLQFDGLTSSIAALTIGNAAGTSGFVMNSGTLTSTTGITIGNAAGTSTFVMNGGSLTSSNAFTTGNNAASINSYTQNGGVMTFNGSTTPINLGSVAGSTNTFTLSGGTFNDASAAGSAGNIGTVGPTTFNQTGGLFNDAQTNILINVAGTAGAPSSLNISGGTFSAAGNASYAIELGLRDQGTLNVSGNALVLASSLTLTRLLSTPPPPMESAIVNLSGGTLQAATIFGGQASGGTQASIATFNFEGGMLRAGASSTTWIPANTTMTFYVQNGGAIINTNNFNDTISQPLLHFSGATTDSLTKLGGGVLTLSGSNTYAAGTIVSAGTLQMGSAAALGTGGLNINGGTLNTNTFGPSVTSLSGTSGLITDLATTPAGTTTLTVNQTANTTFSGVIRNGGTRLLALSTGGTGMLTLTGNNTYTGPTNVGAGTLNVNGSLSASNVSVASAASLAGSGMIGGNTTVTGNGVINLSGGTIGGTLGATGGNWLGTGKVVGAVTANVATFNIGSGANLIAPAGLSVIGGALAGAGTLSSALNYTSGSASSFPGSIVGSGNTVTVNNSAAVLALGGSNTYTGTTNITLGALVVNGTHSGGDAYTIASGGTLAGAGTISGTNTVTLNYGGAIAPGPSANAGNIGTLSLPNLATAGGGTVAFDLSGSTIAGNGINDLVAVSGSLSLGSVTSVSINLVNTAVLSTGQYTLFTYGALSTYTTGSLSLADPSVLTPRQSYQFDYGTPGAIYLDVSGNAGNLTWIGGNAGSWDNSGNTTAWINASSAPDQFFAGDNVNFTASNSGTVNINATVAPGLITVTGSYTFAGPGSIIGGGALTVQSPAALTIANAGNSYTLGTNIQGGSVTLAVDNGLSSAGTVTFGSTGSAGTFDLAGFNQTVGGLGVASGATAASQIITASIGNSTLTFSNTTGIASVFPGTIQDTATTTGGTLGLTVSNGTLDVSAGQAIYYGATTVNGGLLIAGSLPNTSGIYVGLGGALSLSSSSLALPAISNYGTMSFTSTSGSVFLPGFSGNGTFNFNSPTATMTDVEGAIINLNGTALSLTSGNQLAGGAINGTGSVTLNGSGTLMLGGSNTYSGGTTLGSSSTLILNSNTALGTGSLTIAGGTIDSTMPGITLANNAQNWNGDFTFLGTQNLSMGSGAVTLGGNRQVTVNSGTLSVGGAISGSGLGIAKEGNGTLVLGGNNTYSGATVINFGSLQLGNANGLGVSGSVSITSGTLDIGGYSPTLGYISGGTAAGIVNNGSAATLNLFVNSGTQTFAGAIANGTGNVGLTLSGSGSLLLTGNNNYGGTTIVNGGTLQIGGGASSVGAIIIGNVAGTSGFIMNGGSLTATGGFTTGNNAASINSYTQNGGVLTFSSATAALNLGGVAGSTSTFTLSGGTFNDVTTVGGLAGNIGDVGSTTFNQTGGLFNFAPSDNLINVAGTAGAPSSLNISGGTFSAASNSAYGIELGLRDQGTLNISGNALVLASSLTLNRNISPQPATESAIVNLSGGTLQAAIIVSGYATGGASIGTFNFKGGMLQAGSSSTAWIAANTTMTFYVQNGGAIINTNNFADTISQPLLHFSGATTDSLTKLGGGVLTLSASNTYAGGTTIDGGTLKLGSTAALGSGGVTDNNGILDINGLNPTVASLSGSGGIVTDLGLSAGTLHVNQSIATTFSGTIQDGFDPIGLTLQSSSLSHSLTLMGVNTYSGTTTINGGSLVAGAASVLSPNSALILNSGLLDATAAAQTVSSFAANGGTLNLQIGNLFTASGFSQLTAGDLNVVGVTSGSAELIALPGGYSGTFASYALPMGYTLAYNSNDNEIDVIGVSSSSSGPSSWNVAGSGSWAVPSNWSTGSAPNGQGAVAIMGSITNTPTLVSLDSAQTVGTLVFNNSAGYTLTPGSAGSLTLDNTGGTGAALISVLSGSQTILASLTLANSSSQISLTGGGSLTIAGNILDGDGGNAALTLSSSDGTGLLTLSGSNSFGGGMTVVSGMLVLDGASSLAPGSSLAIGSGSSGPLVVSSPAIAGEGRTGSPVLAPVPEPGTLALLAAAAVAVVLCRRRSLGAKMNVLAGKSNEEIQHA